MKLSIIIPVYNEEKTIATVIDRVLKVNLGDVKKEVIVVDDGSTDGTAEKIKGMKNKEIIFIKQKINQGKGSAVKVGINKASGDYIVIQDADLEYDPKDIKKLLKQVVGDKSVIYGTRLNRMPHLNKEESRFQFLMHYFGNRFLSLLTSVLYGQWITDMETCYKLFPRKEVKVVTIKSKRFDFEPEITSKLLKRGLKIKEIPITTRPRGYEDGKKLNTVRDGSIALWSLIKYRFTD